MKPLYPEILTVKDITSAIGGLVIACGIIVANGILFEKLPEACGYPKQMYMPTIQEMGKDYVILGGNNIVLRPRGIYHYEDTWDMVIMRLYRAEPGGADFIINKNEYNPGEPPGIPPMTSHDHCWLHVDRAEKTFQPHFPGRLITPKDFPADWRISRYTEYIYHYDLSPTPVEWTDVSMEAVHGPGRYEIRLGVRAYETEAEATEAFDYWLRNASKGHDKPEFVTRLDPYLLDCAGYSCSYFGLDHNILVDVFLSTHMMGYAFGEEDLFHDWQDLVTLIEDKLLR